MEISPDGRPPSEKALSQDIDKLNKSGRRLVNYAALAGIAMANAFYYESKDDWDMEISNPNNFASYLLLGFGAIGTYVHGKEYLKQRAVVRYRQQMRDRK